jgi:hypothetical protein
MRVFCLRATFSADPRKRFLTSLISPPAQGATVLKVFSKRLDVWSHGTVVCLYNHATVSEQRGIERNTGGQTLRTEPVPFTPHCVNLMLIMEYHR